MPSVGNTFPAESAKSGRIRFFFIAPAGALSYNYALQSVIYRLK